jgi:lysozyme
MITPPMSYGKNGLHLTQDSEQCQLMPYQDSKGVWTDGWGNTHGVIPHQAITQEKADAQLLSNVQDAVDAVNRYVTVSLTQNQFDALVDLVFNIGVHAFFTSTLLKLLNAGKTHEAGEQILVWDKCGGVRLAGLDHRRIAEQFLFNSPEAA